MGKKIKISSIVVFSLILINQTMQAQDEILFRKHLVNSGINGLFYGLAIDVIAGVDGGAAGGIPIIAAGTSVLVPLLTNSSRTISQNSMILSAHGKIVGWEHGFAFATLVGGENAWNNTDNLKLTIAAGAITSIGLGIVGNTLGQNVNWTEGQVALYRQYGWIMPFTGVSIMAAISDEPRLWAASDLIFGTGGYFLADKVYKHYQFTRGDVRAIRVLSVLNGGLGYGILEDKSSRSDFSRSDLLFPALGALSGTLIGQAWLKNVNLSLRQGMQTAYAATGGAVIGFGIALLTGSDQATPYYLFPYITGLGAYAIAVESMRKNNKTQPFPGDSHKNNWEISFMPQNVYLNSVISQNGFRFKGRTAVLQPIIAASLNF